MKADQEDCSSANTSEISSDDDDSENEGRSMKQAVRATIAVTRANPKTGVTTRTVLENARGRLKTNYNAINDQSEKTFISSILQSLTLMMKSYGFLNGIRALMTAPPAVSVDSAAVFDLFSRVLYETKVAVARQCFHEHIKPMKIELEHAANRHDSLSRQYATVREQYLREVSCLRDGLRQRGNLGPLDGGGQDVVFFYDPVNTLNEDELRYVNDVIVEKVKMLFESGTNTTTLCNADQLKEMLRKVREADVNSLQSKLNKKDQQFQDLKRLVAMYEKPAASSKITREKDLNKLISMLESQCDTLRENLEESRVIAEAEKVELQKENMSLQVRCKETEEETESLRREAIASRNLIADLQEQLRTAKEHARELLTQVNHLLEQSPEQHFVGTKGIEKARAFAMGTSNWNVDNSDDIEGEVASCQQEMPGIDIFGSAQASCARPCDVSEDIDPPHREIHQQYALQSACRAFEESELLSQIALTFKKFRKLMTVMQGHSCVLSAEEVKEEADGTALEARLAEDIERLSRAIETIISDSPSTRCSRSTASRIGLPLKGVGKGGSHTSRSPTIDADQRQLNNTVVKTQVEIEDKSVFGSVMACTSRGCGGCIDDGRIHEDCTVERNKIEGQGVGGIEEGRRDVKQKAVALLHCEKKGLADCFDLDVAGTVSLRESSCQLVENTMTMSLNLEKPSSSNNELTNALVDVGSHCHSVEVQAPKDDGKVCQSHTAKVEVIERLNFASEKTLLGSVEIAREFFADRLAIVRSETCATARSTSSLVPTHQVSSVLPSLLDAHAVNASAHEEEVCVVVHEEVPSAVSLVSEVPVVESGTSSKPAFQTAVSSAESTTALSIEASGAILTPQRPLHTPRSGRRCARPAHHNQVSSLPSCVDTSRAHSNNDLQSLQICGAGRRLNPMAEETVMGSSRRNVLPKVSSQVGADARRSSLPDIGLLTPRGSSRAAILKR
eukprot:TRINITY_DN34332_c0_g1_i1.p1 TRINITY_DN34332_c0_g1~~TRINITY_DN34332_c0_g1_i1.p1  ORF type:complete len:961 (-),score=186.37 TRINITY_DN34332_c0_g1_i1:125-3007(-)